jgi:hypothetical protein
LLNVKGVGLGSLAFLIVLVALSTTAFVALVAALKVPLTAGLPLAKVAISNNAPAN